MDGSMARRTSLAASRKVRSASPMPDPSFSRSFWFGALLAGAAGGGCMPAASNAWRSIVGTFASDCWAGCCVAFEAACWAMTRSTAALFTTALKPEGCAGAAGVEPGVPGLGVPAGAGGGATGGGVTGFQACWATMYAVVPGVAPGPICGGAGGGAARTAVAPGGGGIWPNGCGGGTGWGPPETTCASTACACSGACGGGSTSRISFLKPLRALPTPSPIFGSLPAPKTIRTIARIRISSVTPMVPNIQSLYARVFGGVKELGREDGDDGGLDGNAGDECVGLGEIDVHLAPDADFAGEIDARLDRKARVREQAASVPGLEVVDVGAVAVDFFADRVPGAVEEPVSKACLPDHAAAHVVHIPAAREAARAHFLLDERDGVVARARDDREDLGVAGRHALTDVTGPGDVPVHAARRRVLRPQVDQDQVPAPDWRRAVLPRGEVWVGGVGVDGGDGRCVSVHAARGDAGQDVLLQVALGEGRATDDLLADACERLVHDLPQLGGRLAVRRVLVFCPDRFEPLHQVGRGYDLYAERPDELDGAGVHARDVRDGVQRRVLHGDLGRASQGSEHMLEVFMLFLPGQVESAFTRHVVQRMWLDPVQELLRHSLRGNQVVPASGHVAVGIELQDAGGQGVAAAKIVEQPAVKPGFLEGLLDRAGVVV